eukprot:2914784-Pyramimonas_sp.AAC.2
MHSQGNVSQDPSILRDDVRETSSSAMEQRKRVRFRPRFRRVMPGVRRQPFVDKVSTPLRIVWLALQLY